MKFFKLIYLAAILAVFPAITKAQQSSPAAQSSSQTTTTPSALPQTEREEEIEKNEQKQRMLGVVPMFTVTSRQNAPPLTPGEKFHLFVRSTFDPFEYAAAGLQAGINQAENNFPEYGQGAAGFGKRYGAAFADQISSGFFSNYFYPVLLKEDPRYFRLGQGSVRHRIGYSLAQEFIAHADSGKRTFNFSNTLGAVSTGGLSNLYYPESSRGFGLTMSRAGISILYGSVGGLADEFWPDIQRKITRKRPAARRAP
jgi:hypothetical protein